MYMFMTVYFATNQAYLLLLDIHVHMYVYMYIYIADTGTHNLIQSGILAFIGCTCTHVCIYVHIYSTYTNT